MDADSRSVFREVLPLDDDTWSRGRAWALWQALIVASEPTQINAFEYVETWRVIAEVLGNSK